MEAAGAAPGSRPGQCFALSGKELDPRGPRFENAGLWRKVEGEVQLRGEAVAWDAHARAKCEVGIEV